MKTSTIVWIVIGILVIAGIIYSVAFNSPSAKDLKYPGQNQERDIATDTSLFGEIDEVAGYLE